MLKPGRIPAVVSAARGELRHEQQPAAVARQAEIHAAGVVGEYSVAEHALEEALGFGIRIGGSHADERGDAALNAAEDALPDTHLGVQHALNERDHRPRGARLIESPPRC